MKNYEQFIQGVLKQLATYDYIHSSDIPNIDLYMDQVTTFMDEHLDFLKRESTDKILTKTMINNYSKCKLLPTTNKKKYSKDHMILLILVYSLKHTLSIPDIQSILVPLQKIVKEDEELDLSKYYDALIGEQENLLDEFSNDILRTLDISDNLLKDKVSPENHELLSVIASVYMLSMQAAIQKHIATKLIDEYFNNNETK